MSMRDFFRDIPCSLNGKNYGKLSERSMGSAMMYVTGLVMLAFLLMCIFGIPHLLSFGNYIDDQLQKIDKIQIDGKILMHDPIVYPENDPIIAIDATNNTKKAEAKNILITQEYFYWKPFIGETKKVKMADWFRNPESKKAIASFIFLFVLLVLPGFLFWWLVLILLKYLFIITLFAGLFFIILDLTSYRRPFKKVWNICAYASTLLIFIEVIFIPLGTDSLIPLFSIFWGSIQFYLVTLVLYLSVVILALLFAERGVDAPVSTRRNDDDDDDEEPKSKKEVSSLKKKYDDEDIPIDVFGNKKDSFGGKNDSFSHKKDEEFTKWDSPVEKF